MPYRRLPNTDSSRLKALKTGLEKGKEIPPFKLAFKQNTLSSIRQLLPSYENALSEHKNAYNLQMEKGKAYNKAMKKARMYISHFIHVINMAVQRGEVSESAREFFQLADYDKKLPSLQTEEEIINWANILSQGEQKRQMKGKSPITNPTIAVVKVHCDNFKEVCAYQKALKKRVEKAQDELILKRVEADALIQRLWNEIEETFKGQSEEERRSNAEEYGVVYVFRKNELKNNSLINVEHLQAI